MLPACWSPPCPKNSTLDDEPDGPGAAIHVLPVARRDALFTAADYQSRIDLDQRQEAVLYDIEATDRTVHFFKRRKMTKNNVESACCRTIDIAEQDVIAAMKEIQGYIDISPGDFQEVFRIAYRHAMQRLMDSRTASDIMTTPVHCLQADMDLVQAAQFLAEQHFSGAPVVDGSGKLAGVLSEKDFLARMGIGKPASFMQIVAHCLTNRGCMAMSLRNHAVGELMSTPPITAGVNMTVTDIAALFVAQQINRLPIVDSQGRPLGIVTRTDLVQSYCLPGGERS